MGRGYTLPGCISWETWDKGDDGGCLPHVSHSTREGDPNAFMGVSEFNCAVMSVYRAQHRAPPLVHTDPFVYTHVQPASPPVRLLVAR